MIGYFIGGMITAILFFNLDERPSRYNSAADA